jgi:hypothetical protein
VISRLILQPYVGNPCLADVLTQAVDQQEFDRLLMASAWVRRSGLRLIEKAVSSLRSAGGSASLVTGVSLSGATVQGLQSAHELFDKAFVFHQPGRTFHPKLALLTGPRFARAFVGSGNLTAGGLVENWEVGVELTLDREQPDDSAQIAELEHYFTLLMTDAHASRQLTTELIRQMQDDPGIQLGDEDSPSSGLSGGATAGGSAIFQRTAAPIRRALRPVRSAELGVVGAAGADTAVARLAERASSAREPARSEVELRWSKKLPEADAQRLASSAPTNTVALTQANARGKIKHATWFRETLFGDAVWTQKVERNGARYELAIVEFDVWLYGQRLGVHPLEVRHTPRFSSGQSNRAGSLHWGGPLRQLVAAVDLTGDTLTIERLVDGSFRLTLSDAPVGPVMVGH